MAFNPSEARDDHGRWTSGGGTGVYDKLTVNSILNAPPVGKPGSKSNGEIAKFLNARGHEALVALGVPSGVIEAPSGKAKSDPKEDNILSSAIASEIENELSRGEDKHADNWYSSKMVEAMDIAQKLHPEMVDNPALKFAFTAAMAITSQGETVPSNTRLADGVYQEFEKSGKFPEKIEAKSGKEMGNNFAKLNKLIGELGVAGTQEFLNKEFTVGELKKQGYVVTGENVGAKVYGSAILGPKIGQGFYQNLNGNFKPLTADMWLMRGWGRLTGTLTGTIDLTKPKARFEAALKEAKMDIPKDRDAMVAKANELTKAHTKDFYDNREAYDSGEKKKSELSYSAERYAEAVDGIKDQPSGGGQRQHIRDVFDQAQRKLADAGHKMDIADMQATWWYPEKRLYSKLGSRNTERINTDYATVLREMATKKGVKL